jgi:hypothetical protein
LHVLAVVSAVALGAAVVVALVLAVLFYPSKTNVISTEAAHSLIVSSGVERSPYFAFAFAVAVVLAVASR